MSYLPVLDEYAIVPIGTILIWPSAVMPLPPANITFKFVLCDGTLYSKNLYPVAASIITAYGQTLTQFAVPDLRGRFPIGAGANPNINVPGTGSIGTGTAGASRNVGAFGGEENHIQTVDELAAHSHVEQASVSPSGSTHGIIGDATTTGAGEVGISTLDTGGNTPMSTIPSFTAINFIIRLL